MAFPHPILSPKIKVLGLGLTEVGATLLLLVLTGYLRMEACLTGMLLNVLQHGLLQYTRHMEH